MISTMSGTRVGQCCSRLPCVRRSVTRPLGRRLVVYNNSSGWKKWLPFGKEGGGDGSSPSESLEKLFKKKPGGGNFWQKDTSNKQEKPKPSGGRGGPFGGGGAGSGGEGWNWGGTGDSGKEPSILEKFIFMMKSIWNFLLNCAIFLAFSSMLHRSLDWVCQIELLLLVGAPKQAGQKISDKFFGLLESLQKNWLGWKMPEDTSKIPMYRQLALFYPPEHAYTFDSYKYPMTDREKKLMKNYYALKWWEREGGKPGDVNPKDIQEIYDKYHPNEVDLRAWEEARANGTVEEYWNSRDKILKQQIGKDNFENLRPRL